ncbi:MAG: deoxyribonuclease IV [Chloroflexota bacterium]
MPIIGGPRIGAHVNGGIKGGVTKALEIGAQALQVFIGSPQTWRSPNPLEADIAAFKDGVTRHNLGPVFVHGIYLMNLASVRVDVYDKSIIALRNQLEWSNRIGAEGLIFHPGSAMSDSYAVALDRVVRALTTILDGYDGHTRIVLEVCAGQGETIGDRFEELADIIHALGNDDRLGVCWDTCHLFNAGFDIATESGLTDTIAQFHDIIGFERLYAIHANDSKNPLGARLDRHENIGQGHIGEAAFERMLHHPALRDLPWMLEVPGQEKKGPDAENIQILRRLAGLPVSPLSAG